MPSAPKRGRPKRGARRCNRCLLGVESAAPLGSHREHHWHWGQGRLGLEGLKVLLDREEFAEIPGILETPKEDKGASVGKNPDLTNLKLLKKFAANR